MYRVSLRSAGVIISIIRRTRVVGTFRFRILMVKVRVLFRVRIQVSVRVRV